MADQIQRSVHPQEAMASPKVEWPEVVALTVEEAEKKIKEDMPTVHIEVIPSDCFVTTDYQTGRVRIFTDTHGKVHKPPRVG